MKNFKKVISVVMALAMIISSFTAVSAAKFADVADTAAYTEAVEVLAALGIVNGVEQENGTFNFEPEKLVTRAEAATMIVGAIAMADDAKAAAGTSQFGDVNSQAAWAAGYVNVGVAQGFINGYNANEFGPLDNVTYAQMCVMLTQIIGYGDYAKAYGGWPTGYTMMAANAGINKGVAVATDADLTKGQVAMMIWNALQAPLLGVSEYAIDGNVYKPQTGKNETEYKTLFTEKFDGFTAKITINDTPLTKNVDENVVDFSIVKSDWWLPAEVPFPIPVGSSPSGAIITTNVDFVEGVDINSNLLQTGKAVFLIDENDESSMIYFKATERAASKELAADTYFMQADTVDSKQYADNNLKLRFGSSYYKMDDNIAIYVNGVEYDTATSATYAGSVAGYDLGAYNNTATGSGASYNGVGYPACPDDTASLTGIQQLLDDVLGNAHGTVKLLQSSTEAKGYDTIFVDLYQVAEVIGVDERTDATTIELGVVASYLNVLTQGLDKIIIEKDAVEDGKTVVTVTKNGEEATLSSIAIGDIIAYSTAFWDGSNGAVPADIKNPREIDIIATTDKISGTVSAKDDKGTAGNIYDDEYTIGGAVYTITPLQTGVSLAVTQSVDVTLDPFGRVFKSKANAESVNYAIALRRNVNDDSIKLLLADGTTKTYEVNKEKATTYVTNFVSNDINRVVGVAGRIVNYRVSGKDGKIVDINKINPTLTSNEYKARTSLLGGGNKILESTPIILLADNTSTDYSYYQNEANYSLLTKSDLIDTTIYDCYVTKVPTTTTVGFVVIDEAGSTFGESSRFAVAISAPATVLTEDGDTVMSVKALYNGEIQDLLFAVSGATNTSIATNLSIGNVFFFETDSDGYVKSIFVDGPVSALPSATSFTYFDNAGNTVPWTNKITASDWAYGLEEPTSTADIQFVHGVVTEVTSNDITFANYAQVNSGSLDTTLDIDVTTHWTGDLPSTPTFDESANIGNGVVTYGFASDCVAYTEDTTIETLERTEKFEVTAPAAIRASRLAIFDAHDAFGGNMEDGKYGNNLATGVRIMDRATTAVAMIVDGEVVAIYAVER